MRRFLLAVGLLVASVASPAAEPPAPVAIIGALEEEVVLLKSQLQEAQAQEILGHVFSSGTLKGRKVVLARSGVGKVNAAMLTTLLVDRFKPSVVLFTGIAGAINPELAPGDIVIGAQAGPHDAGMIAPQGLLIQPAFIAADPSLLAAARKAADALPFDAVEAGIAPRAPRIVTGTIVTGDVFIASSAKKEELRKLLGADAVEMEGSAVAQVCLRAKTPCLVIRSISDGANDAARRDIQAFRKTAATNSAKLTLAILEGLDKSATEAAAEETR